VIVHLHQMRCGCTGEIDRVTTHPDSPREALLCLLCLGLMLSSAVAGTSSLQRRRWGAIAIASVWLVNCGRAAAQRDVRGCVQWVPLQA
jgi:hypothetical protein